MTIEDRAFAERALATVSYYRLSAYSFPYRSSSSIKKYTSEKAFDEDGAWHHEKITLLRAALKKREELKQAYAQEGTDINPLLLIQFPNDTSDELSQEEETLRESLEKYLEAYPGAVYLFDNEDEGIRF